MVFIYVLKLGNNKYYIGKTTNPRFRLDSHFSKETTSWVRKHNAEQIIELIPDCDHHDEDKYTIKYMKKYGISNVRGGSFCEINLSRDNYSTLQKMIKGSEDKCYNCGKKGHYARDCPEVYEEEEIWECPHCGKEFDTYREAEIHERRYCKHIKNIKCASCSKLFTKKQFEKHTCDTVFIITNGCTRCGRDFNEPGGHLTEDCFAKTDINGKILHKKKSCEKPKTKMNCKRCGRDGHRASSCYAKRDIFGSCL